MQKILRKTQQKFLWTKMQTFLWQRACRRCSGRSWCLCRLQGTNQIIFKRFLFIFSLYQCRRQRRRRNSRPSRSGQTSVTTLTNGNSGAIRKAFFAGALCSLSDWIEYSLRYEYSNPWRKCCSLSLSSLQKRPRLLGGSKP